MAQKVTEKEVLARLVSHCSKKLSSFMRRDKTADRQLERKNMASLSGCEEEVNSEEGKRASETKEENRLSAHSSSCFETKGTLEQNTPRRKKPS